MHPIMFWFKRVLPRLPYKSDNFYVPRLHITSYKSDNLKTVLPKVTIDTADSIVEAGA